MGGTKVRCSFCGKKFPREARRVNEAKKLGWKQYCSLRCQSLAKNRQQICRCGNPLCSKIFKRQLHEISSRKTLFCSSSCAAVVNNSKFPKRRPKIRTCPLCGKQFSKRRKYCSEKCKRQSRRVSKEQIIKEVKAFYRDHGRIPLKRESRHYKAARLRFGTWNKAIKAAGFNPNPELFAKKHFANDGHRCDSLAEKIIDDWFYARKIKHRINVPYPGHESFTADFVVQDQWIEFFGLAGEISSYDRLKKRKLQIVKSLKLNFIAIYPAHLFPKSKLNEILGFLSEKNHGQTPRPLIK